MALQQYQNVGMSSPQLASVPSVAPRQSNTGVAFAQAASAIVPSVMQGLANRELNIAKQEQSAFDNKLDSTFSKVVAAGATNAKFDTVGEARKLATKLIKDNPTQAAAVTAKFKKLTGEEYVGLSFEQQAFQANQEAAWKAGFGEAGAPADYNAKQYNLYMAEVRAGADADFRIKQIQRDEAEGRVTKQAAREEGMKSVRDIASIRTEANTSWIEHSYAKVQANPSLLPQYKYEIQQKRREIESFLAEVGLSTDPEAMAYANVLKGQLDDAEKLFKGGFDKEAYDALSAKRLSQQKAIITANPKAAPAIAASELFGHNVPTIVGMGQDAINSIFTNTQLLDFSDVSSVKLSAFNDALVKVAATPEGREEVKTISSKAVNNLTLSDDMSLEDLAKYASPLSNLEVFNTLPANKQDQAVDAASRIIVDKIGPMINEFNEIGVVSEAPVSYPASSPVNRHLTLEDYAEVQVTDTGIRYKLNPDYLTDAAARRRVNDINKKLSTVDGFFGIMRNGSGMSNEEVAIQFGLMKSEEQQVEATDGFKSEFIQTALDDGKSEEEANALWEQVSSPATDDVEIGGVKMTKEQAKKLLSTPAK